MPEPVTMITVGGSTAAMLMHLARRHFETAKDVLDIAMGFVCLVIFSPLLLLCAVLIKLSSRGPVFFRQVRVGKDGALFTMYKLRTMRPDAEVDSGAVWAADNDPRVIPVCRWMRRSHVDELPQLINVVMGDMSLVGPRPERPEILAELERHYPNVRHRLAVRPGITGLAQITNGYDTSVDDFRHKLEADLRYIHRRSWRQELRILTLTVSRFFADGKSR